MGRWVGFCALCRSPPRPTLAATLPIFPHGQRPSFITHWPRPPTRPPSRCYRLDCFVFIKSTLAFPACAITSPWSTPPQRRDYQRGVSIAEVGAGVRIHYPRQRSSTGLACASADIRRGRHTFTFSTHPLHAKITPQTPRDWPHSDEPPSFPRECDEPEEKRRLPTHRQHARNSTHESHQGGHQFTEPYRPGL